MTSPQKGGEGKVRINTIIQGDAMEVLKTLESESVDCCVTSPPYWALRNYQVKNQLGMEATFEEHIQKICNVFDEIKRVLKKQGNCWVNYGDTYIGSPPGNKFDGQKDKGDGLYSRLIQRNGIGEDNAKVIVNKYPDPKNPNSLRSREQVIKQSLPDKCLAIIPFRFAIEMVNRGWILRNVIIWHKPNCMPTSVKDRFTVDFEYIFFFVKNKRYYFEQIFDPNCEISIKRAEYEKHRKNPSSIGSKSENYGMPARFVKINPQGHNKRCVWKINTQPFRGAHFATFPTDLIEPMIKAGCPKDGIVLDCFMGAGTTAVVAKKLGRNYLGIELNKKYIEMAEARIQNTQGMLV